jgi:hypothetical protein
MIKRLKKSGGNFRVKPENYPHIYHPPQRFQETLHASLFLDQIAVLKYT